jgi:hypothetical protein
MTLLALAALARPLSAIDPLLLAPRSDRPPAPFIAVGFAGALALIVGAAMVATGLGGRRRDDRSPAHGRSRALRGSMELTGIAARESSSAPKLCAPPGGDSSISSIMLRALSTDRCARRALLVTSFAIAACGGASGLDDGDARRSVNVSPPSTSGDASADATLQDADADAGGDGTSGAVDASHANDASRANDAASTSDASDAATCGPCAGTCYGARCLTVLASNQAYPVGIAVGAHGVYWANEGRPDTFYAEKGVLTVGLNGGATRLIASTPEAQYDAVVADDSSVVWIDKDRIVAGPSETSAPSWPHTVLAADARAAYLAMDAAGVYWTSYVSYAAPTAAVSRMDRDGANPRELMEGQGTPEQVLVHNGRLTWQAYDNYMTSMFDVETSGASAHTLVSGLGSGLFPWAAMGGNLYWASNYVPIDLYRMSLSGGAPVVVAAPYTASGMTADDTTVYFTSDNAVYALRNGNAPEALAWKLPSPGAIAVDADSLYWADYGHCDATTCTGAILKLTPK